MPTFMRLSRREVLCKIGGGFGTLGLASILADAGLLAAEGERAPVRGNNPLAPRPPHFRARAKRVIFLFMNGGPSHVDTFDPKPALEKYQGKPLPKTMVKTGRKGGGQVDALTVPSTAVRPERHRGDGAVSRRSAAASTTSA